jgi:PKD repeat protein
LKKKIKISLFFLLLVGISALQAHATDTLQAKFTLDTANGCAPFTIDVTNNSNGAQRYEWYIDGGFYSANETPPPATFTNNTSMPATHYITLLAINPVYTDSIDSLRRPVKVYPGITADFTPSNNDVCAPHDVLFTNTSTGNTSDTLYQWFFGDENSSQSVNPVHTYNNNNSDDTTFTAMLIATSPYFCTDTATDNIIAHPKIEAGFTVDTTTSCDSLTITIFNTSSGVDTFFLDFGDGSDTTFSSFTTIKHTYNNTTAAPQTYNIALIGGNEENCYDTMYRSIEIYPRVTAGYYADITHVCDSTVIQFTDTSAGYNLTYYWDFGDGGSSNTKDPSHLYTNNTSNKRTDTVRLIVESAFAQNICIDTVMDTVIVYPYIKADFTSDSVAGCPPFDVNIVNQSVGVDNYSWDFGDATQSNTTDSIFSHTYTNTSFTNDSVYNLSLKVTNTYGCSDSISRQITAYPSIASDFDADIYQSCDPAAFNFTSNSQGATYYFWIFGDGATSIQPNTSNHLYKKNMDSVSQDYAVTLLVTADNYKCYDTYDTIVSVHPYINSAFTISNYLDCTPFETTFENSSTGTTNSYEWYIDGAQIITAPSDTSGFNYTFTNTTNTIESHTIRLRAENNEGCTDNFYDTIGVYPEVKAGFEVVPGYEGCHPFNVQFSDTSKNADTYNWSFGDYSTTKEQHPAHKYNNPSNIEDTTYIVELTASLAHCADTVYDTITVFAKPKAKFELDKTIDCPPLEVAVENQSDIISGSYYWDYGDGTLDTNNTKDTITRTYQNTSTVTQEYTISLQAYTDDGCGDTTSSTVRVYPAVSAGFTYDSSGCSPFTSTFIDTSKNASAYHWDFGDGTTTSLKHPTNTYRNESSGDKIYTVTLLAASEYGCSDTVSHQVAVFPSPEATFYVNPTSQLFYNEPLPEITISNNTRHYDTWNYSWDFGDNTTSDTVAETIIKTYQEWGDKNDYYRYYITMIAYNADHNQCADTTQNVIYIKPPSPEFELGTIDTTGCVPLTVQFSITSSAYQDSITWNFGDGTIAYNKSNPSHTYTAYGTYQVVVTLSGQGGSTRKYITIIVHRKPTVHFAVSPNLALLSKPTGEYKEEFQNQRIAVVQFYNQSEFDSLYLWKFDDEAVSNDENPTHAYTEEGEYIATLVVWSEHGCKDSLTADLINEEIIIGNELLEFPNAFKPDVAGPSGGRYSISDDGSTIFRPYWESVVDYNLKIFNRWGELLFESHDVLVGWDGYYKGRLCKQDVYIWKADAIFKDGTSITKKGIVTLLR